jgi:hypothetical protein
MDHPEHLAIDVYPWAQPTPEQRRMFDALSPLDKRAIILAAIENGFESPLSSEATDDLRAKFTAKFRHES